MGLPDGALSVRRRYDSMPLDLMRVTRQRWSLRCGGLGIKTDIGRGHSLESVALSKQGYTLHCLIECQSG